MLNILTLKNLMNFLIQFFIIFFMLTSDLLADILDEASKFTVRVRTSIDFSFAEDEAGTLYGAGFLVDESRRYIVTNAHVSGRGNARIEVAFKGFGYETANAVYVDPILDLAVLQVDNTSLPENARSARLDCSKRYLNGIAVAAYGHPHGLSFSASRGIISQVRTYESTDWVQTDAAINPGNSGGALIELETGLVVGVNAMGFEDTQGLNFAVPMQPVCSIIDMLKNDLVPSPPAFPMFFASDEELDTHLTVAGNIYGPLPKKIQVGDQLTLVNGVEVFSPNDIVEQLRAYSGKVDLSFLRGNLDFEISLELEPQLPILDRPFIIMDGALIAEDVYPQRRLKDGLFQIHSIAAGSQIEQSYLTAYQLIVSVNGIKPNSIEHLYELLKSRENIQLITRSWSERDYVLHDYFLIHYQPNDIKSYN